MFHNLGQLLRYRGLIQSLVARELKARYRGSVLGFFWSFFNPLLLLLVYTFVFNYVLLQRNELANPYALFLFCGLLPWTWFATSLTESAGVLISGGNLIKKVLFPAEVLPIVTVLANMVHFLLGLPIVAVFLVYYQRPLHIAELVWFPVVVLVQLVMTLGFALIIAALTVHFRDLRDILANLLTVWFFATPIIYPWTQTPWNQLPAGQASAGQASESIKQLFNLNPFLHLAVSYQEILFFEGPFGHLKWLLVLGAISVAFFLFGFWVFDRLRDTFAEEV